MRDLKARDFDAYQHVYQGKPRQTLMGAIYARSSATPWRPGVSAACRTIQLKVCNVYWIMGSWTDTRCGCSQLMAVRSDHRFHQDSGRASIGTYL